MHGSLVILCKYCQYVATVFQDCRGSDHLRIYRKVSPDLKDRLQLVDSNDCHAAVV